MDSSRMGMNVNIVKTEVSKKKKVGKVSAGEKELNQVRDFVYLKR